MSCSGSGADPEAAPASAASAPGPAPPVSAPAALPTSTAAENKASPAGTAGGPGAGAAAAGTGPVAARAGEPAERRGAGEGSALDWARRRGRAESTGQLIWGPTPPISVSQFTACPSAPVSAGGAAPPEGAVSNGVYVLPNAANGDVKPVVSSTPLVDFLMQLEDYTPTVGFLPERPSDPLSRQVSATSSVFQLPFVFAPPPQPPLVFNFVCIFKLPD